MGNKYLPGAKPVKSRKRHDENEVINLSLKAIEDKYGGLKEGFIALLDSKEPVLIKWVFEHAFGKPKEKIDIDVNKTVENVQIIQIPHNNRDNVHGIESIPFEATQEIAREKIETLHG
jgi:hypothetical protein